MDEARPAVAAFAEALDGVKAFSPAQKEKWITYAGGLQDPFVDFLTSITKANPKDMVVLDKNLEAKKIALSTDNVADWRKLLKGEQELLAVIA